ncbi:DUF3800 domain-containing protein [Azospirillum canadense]|uniref:DUF3800 domain-containing protein n=1 Tax=Azospirillum canadense TaxID=403962 RepID=UPI002227E81E|nr:DUF3800 domain-containing protein [Azospirillum canadense]MCW2242265.1 hypothetical protein [Azospirillum canadense]
MLVFIDESGDPGFKTEKGSTPVFVAAMVIFRTDEDAQRTEIAMRKLLIDLRCAPEFKFNKCDYERRDAFFQAVRNLPFSVRAIVVEKNVIYSPRIRADKERFYEFFVAQMMTHDGGVLQDAKVIIDGSGDREFRNKLNTRLRREMGPGKLRAVRFKDSTADPLLQLADMCAGAIARSHRTNREDSDRWLRALRPKVSDIWRFK